MSSSAVAERLRRTLQLEPGRSLRDARTAPVSELLAFARDMPRGSQLTIDVKAAGELGYVLVVWGSTGESPRAAFDGLTRRERQVAGLVAMGMTNRQIAERLCLTIATVKDHVHRILSKSGLRNRTALSAAWSAHRAMSPERIARPSSTSG